MKELSLSKSLYMESLRCPRLIWLRINQPALAEPLDAQTLYLFRAGHRVEEYAHKLFPGGQLIGKGKLGPFSSLLAETEVAMRSDAPFLYEAAFANKQMHCRTDVLHRAGQRWCLGEVKASTMVKPQHISDTAFQCCCLQACGITVNRTYLVHVNNQYTRQGEIEAEKLLVVEDITEEAFGEAQKVPTIVRNIIEQAQEPALPPVMVGSRCSQPGRCPFYEFCHDCIPAGSVFEIPYGSRIIPQLLKRGISRLVDIPTDIPLSPRQAALVKSVKTGEPIINVASIKDFLGQLQYPLYFLDFETGNFCLPPFDGTSPYERLPFQYSLHIKQSPHGSAQHFEFLPELSSDPRLPLLEELICRIGDHGSIVAWNMSFEKSVLSCLAKRFPEFSNRIDSLLGRFVDLIVPFRTGDYSDARFQGSASLKKVLPVLVPSMSYDNMSIAKGDQASIAYQSYIDGTTTQAEWAAQRRALLTYCCQDTKAMVEILEVLFSLINPLHRRSK